MKKILTVFLGILLFLGIGQASAYADTKEMRGAWISTVYGLDWPSTKNNISAQKQEYINLLDSLQKSGMNTVIVQIRPNGDALYPSSYNVWSSYLTGTQGQNPGYDPLAFMIEEAHKRGMEFHAWMNPYRASNSTSNIYNLAANHPARQNPSWTFVSDGKLYFDPGNPDVINYIVNSVAEVVSNYDIDAIQFDDYFYPTASFDDSVSYNKYGSGMDVADWRRNNVNALIQNVYSKIKSIKSNVEFGVAPAGIWKNSASGTSGQETYSAHYADSVKWIQSGWIDYIAPQIYWTNANKAAPFKKLVDWWAGQVSGTKVKLYIGHNIYDANVAAEVSDHVTYGRNNSNVSGGMYFRAKFITTNPSLQNTLASLNSYTHNKLIGNTRYETSVKVSQEGWSSSSTVLLVNGYANADGITATPLASAYGAPILLSDKDTLPAATKNEIARLGATKVILIGGATVLPDSLINQIKSINSNIQVERLGGSTRYETSLLIAQRIDSIVDVNNAYICYGYGEPDALSIAAKAGVDKTPIILTAKDSLPTATYNWLAGEGLQNAYFLGGTNVLYNSVINQVNWITPIDVSGNRVAGATRYETNAEVMRLFFSDAIQQSVMITKGYVLADALTAGPLAAKKNSPVVIVSDSSLSATQQQVLNTKQTSIIYEIGGGLNASVVQDVINRLR